MNASTLNSNREEAVTVQNGWVWLPIIILLELGSLALFIYAIAEGGSELGHPFWRLFVAGLLGMILAVFLMPGFFTLQPNEARVLLLFGRYRGTVRQGGFHWGNPFYSNGPCASGFKAGLRAAATKEKTQATGPSLKHSGRNKISLRARNLNSDKLKTNDNPGNPIENAPVTPW